MNLGTRVLFVAIGVLLSAPIASVSNAQSDLETGLDVFPNLSLGNLGKTSSEPATFSAQYAVTDGNTGNLSVTANLNPGWHIYSLTQQAGGPTPTKLVVDDKSGVRQTGDFTPDAPALNSVNKAWPGLTIEEHNQKVVWSAKVQLPPNFSGPIEVKLNGLVCKTDGACVPVNKTLVAKPSPTASATAMSSSKDTAPAPADQAKIPAATYRDGEYVVQWTSRIEPSVVGPGQTARLIFTATPDAGYHVYAAAINDAESSTNFVIAEKSGLKIGKPVPSSKPISEAFLPGLPPILYHGGEVTWSLPIQVPADLTPGEKKVEGSIGYQACTDRSCLPPKALRFTGLVVVGEAEENVTSTAAVSLASAPYAATLDAAAETKWVDDIESKEAPVSDEKKPSGEATKPAEGNASAVIGAKLTDEKPKIAPEVNGGADIANATKASSLPLPLILAMAICGGLILNLMPCVLPVVGLKIMAFAEQAGEDKKRVLLLNAWYTLGILAVFWALAAVAVLFSFSWGEQFTYFGFRYGVTLLVFAMALSFLGVWEIPIPGFVGGNSTQKLQRREGPIGAFSKGIFTTLLATPCSGPLLGTVFAFTLGKSAVVTTLIFTAVGIGMALPYLLIALYPSLIIFFPKPGAWMDTFKQLLAFLLLGTVVYLFGGFSDDDRMPVFASLIGVWFGCWLVGQVPGWSSIDRRIAAWLGGAASATLICLLAFRYLAPAPPVLAWEPYNEARLQQLQREGRTVLIDFTAKWCINCIVNYNVAINTPQTSKLVDELGAIPMLADWTDHNDEIKNKLIELNSNSIPVLAIYPGKQPTSPIVLRDLISQGDVLKALRQAAAVTVPIEQAGTKSRGVTQVSNRQNSTAAVAQ